MRLETSDLVGFIKERQARQVRALRTAPELAIIQSGDDPASASFVRAKQRYGADIGVVVKVLNVDREESILHEIERLNADVAITGIVPQLPLPAGFDTDALIAAINPAKDVDGLGPKSRYEPSTAKAILWILAANQVELKDATVCVVGQGRLVGQPVSRLLEQAGAQVDRCDIETSDLASHVRAAKIVVSGVGRPGLITAEMVQPGAVIIDAGTAEAEGKLVGDVDPGLINDPGIKVTPVPGGVGPMTVVALFDNLVIAAER